MMSDIYAAGFEIKRLQSNFSICYVTFDCLQNGNKIMKTKSLSLRQYEACTAFDQVNSHQEK
jgi:hypothetical protein